MKITVKFGDTGFRMRMTLAQWIKYIVQEVIR